MAELKFHCKMPIFVARQWVRTRTANINESSARYRESECEFFYPKEWRLQSATNKQGSSFESLVGEADETQGFFYNRANETAKNAYEIAIDSGVSRELARCVLPVSTYTEWYWKIDIHNLLHFLRLRLAEDAQQEIREYALALATVVREAFPAVWAAFEEFELFAARFSRTELEVLRGCLRALPDRPESMTENEWSDFKRKLEGWDKPPPSLKF
jgi:thymidylate synthase (FAD)